MSPQVDEPINGFSPWLRLLLGLTLVFALFQWSALALGSDRGQAGVVVGVLVLSGLVAVERLLFRKPVFMAGRALGLGAPRVEGLLVVGGISLLLVVVVAVFATATRASLTFLPGSIGLIPGLFMQAGVAEETLFRGYLFGRLRRGRSFWRAAAISMLPFVAVHLFLFFTMPWPIALASVVLAVVLSFPLAHLFELGGATIWAPAFLHFVVQGTIKVVVISGDGSSSFPLVWMAASALVPLLSLVAARPVASTTRPLRGRRRSADTGASGIRFRTKG